MDLLFRRIAASLNSYRIAILAISISAIALASCSGSDPTATPIESTVFADGPSAPDGPYSLVGWNPGERTRPTNANWSIELPSGGTWEVSDNVGGGSGPIEAIYRTRLTFEPVDQPFALVSVIAATSTPSSGCPTYNNVGPDGEAISERLADMQLGEHTAQVYRVTAAAEDGSASGNFNVCFIADGVTYMIDAAARPTLAQVDLFKMLRTFRLDV